MRASCWAIPSTPGSVQEIEQAAEKLKEQKSVVQSYVMDEVFDKMGGGEAALAPYYVGDGVTLMAANPDLAMFLSLIHI